MGYKSKISNPQYKILTYTFRTFPYQRELLEVFSRNYSFEGLKVLSKLKVDIQNLCNEIKKVKPELIIGIALSNKESRIEPVCMNRFHSGTVSPNGPDSFKLFVPEEINFNVAKKPTTSFCNYSMYKIKEFIEKENLDCKLSFIHVAKEDIDKLGSVINNKVK